MPMSFRLPDGWRAVPPEEAGAPGAAFVALNLATAGSGFTANITVEGECRRDYAALADLADASLRDLAEVATAVRLLTRKQAGEFEAPGLTQLVAMTGTFGGAVQEIMQAQFLLAVHDIHDPRKRVVLRTALTSAAGQYAALAPDFAAFVGSLRLGPDGFQR
jgi:hypothetical protein